MISVKLGLRPVKRSVFEIPIELLCTNPNQPRRNFPEDELYRLADSIRRYGLIQPITVRIKNAGRRDVVYEVVAGERRLRACKLLGCTSVSCMISDTDEQTSFELAVVENMVRSDLDMFEQAEAMMKMLNSGAMTQEQVAEKLSVSQGCVANKLRLLKFAPHERKLMIFACLSERHARALLRIEDPAERLSVMQAVIENKMNVAATEEFVSEFLEKASKKTKNTSAAKEEKRAKVKVMLKDTRIFINTLERSVSLLKASGVRVNYEKSQTNSGEMVFSIKIAAS